MKRIHHVRGRLSHIPGALMPFDPKVAHGGCDPGVPVSTVYRPWSPEDDGPTMTPEDRAKSTIYDGGFWGEGEPEIGVGETGIDPVFEVGAEVDSSFPVLGDTAKNQIRKSVEVFGMDALGYYASFHMTGVQWGVYVKVPGLAYLAHHVFKDLPATLETKIHLAFHAILNHELFHFATDYAVAQAELAHNEPWWRPAQVAFSKGAPSYCQQEEKVANAYMLKAFRTMKPALTVRGKQEALRKFTRKQPAGYNEGEEVAWEGWEDNLADLAHCYLHHTAIGRSNPHLSSSGYDWEQQFPIQPRIDWRYCPVFLVDDAAMHDIPQSWLSFFSKIEDIVESDTFLKCLKRMPGKVIKAWENTKGRLSEAVTRGRDLKRWPKGGTDVWSIRVDRSYRAHLRKDKSGWTAIEIGNHREMGHG